MPRRCKQLKSDNIAFRYDLMTVTPSTLKAHRLTWFAGQQDKATAIAERILKAYFIEGQNIAEIEVLANLAAEVGMDVEAVKAFLRSDAGMQDSAGIGASGDRSRDLRCPSYSYWPSSGVRFSTR